MEKFSAKELEQGYTDTGFIPEDGASVLKPEKGDAWDYMPEDKDTKGGFLDRGATWDRM